MQRIGFDCFSSINVRFWVLVWSSDYQFITKFIFQRALFRIYFIRFTFKISCKWILDNSITRNYCFGKFLDIELPNNFGIGGICNSLNLYGIYKFNHSSILDKFKWSLNKPNNTEWHSIPKLLKILSMKNTKYYKLQFSCFDQ